MPYSLIGGKNNVKIFVLYLMRSIGYPMDYSTISDIVMQTDYVMYLDYAESFAEMLDGDLVRVAGKDEAEIELYEVTEKGAIVAEELKSDILERVLDESLAKALTYLDFKRRNITIDCGSQKLPDTTYDVYITVKEKSKVLLNTTINVNSEYHAMQIRRVFRDRPDAIFRGTMGLLCGNVNFLFDQKSTK